jgi:hypothetical protein
MLYVLFVCKCVLPPGVNPIAVDKYINIDININMKYVYCILISAFNWLKYMHGGNNIKCAVQGVAEADIRSECP